jgi:cytochrome c5
MAALALAAIAQQPSNSKPTKSSGGPVYEIVLPQYPPDLPAGPNKQVFERNCLLCHSARYVTMQPSFSKAAWEKSVKKMVDVYGAPIAAAEQQQVVEYLVAIRGAEAGK